MEHNEILPIKTVSRYYDLCGLGKPKHPLMGLYSFEEFPPLQVDATVRFTLGFYVVTLKSGCSCKSQYGQTSYDYDEGVMGFTAPHQVLGVDNDFVAPEKGWCLVFHPDLLLHYELTKKIKSYDFFHYRVSEALILSEDEERDMDGLFQKMKQELSRPIDTYSQDVLIAHLELLLTYANRFYNRQFITRKPVTHDLLTSVEQLLSAYVNSDRLTEEGLPTVQYLSEQLSVSPHYLSDTLKKVTGQSTQQHIHNALLEKAKELLASSALSVSEIAFVLGFEHAPSFSKLFKKKMTMSPLDFRRSFN